MQIFLEETMGLWPKKTRAKKKMNPNWNGWFQQLWSTKFLWDVCVTMSLFYLTCLRYLLMSLKVKLSCLIVNLHVMIRGLEDQRKSDYSKLLSWDWSLTCQFRQAHQARTCFTELPGTPMVLIIWIWNSRRLFWIV